MNQKEYKKKLDQMDTEFSYLEPEERKELRNELKQIEGVKLEGFNGKAIIKSVNGCQVLQSYQMDVCMIKEGKFIKLWNGYSQTTLRQINLFRELNNLNSLNKKEWVMM